jgi:transcriptional regulator with XRE-family HTH domain
MKTIFAIRLKELRNEKNFTQRKIAELMNVSQVSYLHWEQGKTQPDIENIIKLCKLFDVSADYLLGLENE